MGPDQPYAPLLDRLLEALGALQRAGASPVEAEGSAIPHPSGSTQAWNAAFDAILDISSCLDPVREPEVSTHLLAVCDACLTRLDEARLGRPERIDAAISLVAPIRAAVRAISPTACSRVRAHRSHFSENAAILPRPA